MWEWQLLAASGISVYACNPRGSQGYGEAFLNGNVRDWGDGPMRDVMAGLDSLIEDGLVDGDRMGVTGGSYGGYLTSWIVGHTDRFKAAVTCRSVNDMISQMLSGRHRRTRPSGCSCTASIRGTTGTSTTGTRR